MAAKKTSLQNQDYDSPWKQIIEELLESFLEFHLTKTTIGIQRS